MIGIQGFGAVQEPSGSKQGPGRTKESDKAPTLPVSDGVTISPQAAEAAAVTTSVVAEAAATNEVRQERIEQAKESIEQGTYKVQDVVRQVASRLTRFVS